MIKYTDQIRKFISKNKEIIYIFLFTLVAFCMLSHFIPLTGDDWQNYGNGKMGFINALRNIKRYYLNWEGRIVSRTFIVFLTYGKIFWNILNALLFFGISYLIMKFNNIEEKVACFLLVALSILLINYNMFVECFLWVAGNLTYTLPTFLFLIYAYFILNFDKITNKRIIILSFLNFFICLFVENIAVAMIVFNILLNLYFYLKLKKINKLLISQIFISIMGLLIMMLSPGTLMRQGLYDEFNQLSLIGKIYHNLPNFAYYTYIINPISLILVLLAFNRLLVMSNLNKINKVIIIIFMNLIPIMTIISNINVIGPFTFNLIPFLNKISAFFNNSNNIWLLSYWVIFTIIYVFSVLFSKIDFKLKIIFLTALVGTGSMLVSPIWSPRVAFFTIILFYLFSFGIIKDYVFKNRVFNAIIIFVSVLYFVVLLIMYYNVHINIEYQVSYIKDQISVKKDVIEFYDVPGRLLLSSYPYSKGYKGGYNDVYKITQDVEYKKLVCKYDYQIIFNNKRCNL